MLFPTIEFAIFFLITFGLYWAVSWSPGLRKGVLLVASYVFYGWWDWRFLFLLAGVSILAWAVALAIERHRQLHPNNERAGHGIMVGGVVITLGLLGFFKYYLFVVSNLNSLFLQLGFGAPLPIMAVILPVGISFFSFQGISYMIDVYRRDTAADRNPLDVLVYVAFFPQLVAGPIVRGKDFIPQLLDRGKPVLANVERAFILIIGGLFKKVVVANYIGTSIVDPVFTDPSAFGAANMLLASYGYAFQIFCDFSAYSDIAIGVALLFGFRFPANFDQPYRALGIQDFWRRWHISLSSWLRDYLYIPLGGNRRGALRTYINLLATMVLGGLWHGASWTFVLWGLLHGTALIIERLWTRRRSKKLEVGSWIGRFTIRTLTFHFVVLTWIVFRSPDMAQVASFLEGFGQWSLGEPLLLTPFLAVLMILGLAMHFWPPRLLQKSEGIWKRWHPLAIAGTTALALAALGLLSPAGVAPFIYFQF